MDDVPPFDYLSSTSAIVLCFTFSIAYVLGLYLLSPSSRRYERNHPNVICRRFLAVLIVCLLVYLFLKHTCNPNVNINTWLGFRTNLSALWKLMLYPTALTLMLYLGPIIQWVDLIDWRYYRHGWRYHFVCRNRHEQLICLRNYLVAPFTEEFVFRSAILSVLYSHVSLSSAIFASPLFFGLAHFHHMLEQFKQNQHAHRDHRLSALTIVLMHLFQFTYTYIFGVYSSFLFVRTGHFIPSFLVHALCNALGIPDVMNLVDTHGGQGRRKFFYLMCYLIGLWLFSTNLYFLTQSKFYYSDGSGLVTYRHWSS